MARNINDETGTRNFRYRRDVKTQEQANVSSAQLHPVIEINGTSQLRKGMASALSDNDPMLKDGWWLPTAAARFA